MQQRIIRIFYAGLGILTQRVQFMDLWTSLFERIETVEMKIVILGLDGCIARHFIGMTQMLLASSRVITKDTGAPACFEVLTASVDGKPFVDDHGRFFAVDADISSISSCDAVLLPGFAFHRRGEPMRAERAAGLASWIRQRHEQGSLIGASCNGVFMLEATGMLGRRCEAESCALQNANKRCSSMIDAATTTALIEENGAIAASGWLSWVDLTLSLREPGVNPARGGGTITIPSRGLLLRARCGDSPSNLLIAAKALLSDAEQIIKGIGDERLTAHDLALALMISPRTLYRRRKAATGESRRDFIDRTVSRRPRLAGDRYPVKQLAARAGYADEASFRRAFLRRAGVTPGAYRARANSPVALDADLGTHKRPPICGSGRTARIVNVIVCPEDRERRRVIVGDRKPPDQSTFSGRRSCCFPRSACRRWKGRVANVFRARKRARNGLIFRLYEPFEVRSSKRAVHSLSVRAWRGRLGSKPLQRRPLATSHFTGVNC